MGGVGWRSIGVAGVGAAVLVGLVLNAGAGKCSDIDRLVSESITDFEAFRGALVDSSTGEWSVAYSIDGASSCSVVVDPERALYVCTWEHSLSSGDGPERYEAEVKRVRSCLDGAAEREDASVNHPDFWASTHFAIPDGEIGVSLKNKSALGQALVTISAATDLVS